MPVLAGRLVLDFYASRVDHPGMTQGILSNTGLVTTGEPKMTEYGPRDAPMGFIKLSLGSALGP